MAQQAPQIDGVTVGQPAVIPAEFNGDLSLLPTTPTIGAPMVMRPRLPGPPRTQFATTPPAPPVALPAGPLAPMPSPIQNFAGMSASDACTGGSCGGGWPPDTNGDVGPNHYIETVNTSVAIYNKTGTRLAAFTEDNLWSGVGSTPCNGNAGGDPIALYDWLADRFVITWLAFPGSSGPFYQCIAASKTSDPVAGGWWLYAVQMDPGTAGAPPSGYLDDYPKFGLWHDCLYMGANEFLGFGAFKGVSFASFSRSDLYSGAPLTFAIGFLPYPANSVFSMFPSNNNGKGVNAVQPGTPNYYVMESFSGVAFEVRKFTPGANCGSGGTLGAPTNVSHAAYTNQSGAIVPQPNTMNTLDMIDERIMQKVQYRKVAGTESLWVTHPVQNPGGSNTAMQWAQINVTGGTVVTTPVQQQIYSPDNSLYRFMGSLAVDSQGNMALGYTTSNATAPHFPSIAYSGRLATDPLNTLPQTEVVMIAGAGSQTNMCGGAPCDRWGDYSAMSVDPADDCTFWYVNEYYDTQANGTAGNWHTRIGSFKFPSCAPPGPSTTTLATSLTPASAGVTVTFTATVSGSAPTGTVNFKDGVSSIAGCSAQAVTGAGDARMATCNTSTLAVGTHSITASYSGDGGNLASDSGPLSQVILASKDSIGLFNASTQTFFLRNTNNSGPADIAFSFGSAGAVPIKGDWNGDGADTIGVYQPSTGTFFLRNSNTPGPADIGFQFGAPGAVPLAGDWNGDGVDTIGIYVPATGTFFLRNSNSAGPADIVFSFGAGGAGIVPIVGDWDGNGTDTIGLYIQSTGVFFLKNMNAGGAADIVFTFGAGGKGVVPVTGDWDNNGTDTIGLYVTATGTFFLKNTNANGAADMAFTFGGGGAGVVPITGNWDNLP